MSSAQSSRFRAAARLLPRFVMHRRRDIGEIAAALACGDFETIARLGHNMRGNGDSYGFPEVSALGARLEMAANTRDAGAVSELSVLIEAQIAGIERGLSAPASAPSESQVRATHDGAGGSRADDDDAERRRSGR
jgi:HPt (histidine-containing phosphotransfer) domain-containing protein